MYLNITPGIRVVRGPNWMWQNQDKGEGNVGTVCEVGRLGSALSPEKTVVVNWDSGHRTNYRVGYQNQYDLLIIDNAQVGVRHSNVVCDGCSKGGIAGIVFKCAICPNYHLCSFCYGSDLHDKEHSFIRFTTPTSAGVKLPPRHNSLRIQLKGIFVGSTVVRGPDWEWDTQDGGEGKTGRVMEIRGWDNESCRSVANVSWTSGSTNVYRLGHKGNVDLRCIIPTSGGFYYKAHMPVLGHMEEQQPLIATVKPMLSVGDRVKVCLDEEALINIQQGHGGWNPRMLQHLSKLGTVHRITEKGDIRVQYEDCHNRWTFHPAALAKVVSFRVGDLVTIINDATKVQLLQKGHGEWVELMRYALGKLCKVVKVYSDGDLRIEQLEDGFEWTLNPKCVKLERSPIASAAERSNSMMDLSHHRTDHVIRPLSGLSGNSMADKLVRECALGHFDFVKQFLEGHPGHVNVLSGGKACIQVAAHQGFIEIVKFLISRGADVNIIDKEGDSALHYAAFGNQPEAMRMLLQSGANVNFLNSSHCTALHICAHKRTPHCVRELLNFKADVNLQDSYGDTALHDAIGKENIDVVEILCSSPNLDFTVKNNRGFNVLHHAALKGNLAATVRILQLSRQLVNVKKDDGFAAMHLAALNGHADVVEALAKEGQANIDIRNCRRQTPFLLAVSQGHAGVIEKLVSLGCDINARDEDGDNAMNLCVIKRANLVSAAEPTTTDSPDIYKLYEKLNYIKEDRLLYSILCYLSHLGCQIEENNKGINIFKWITNTDNRQLILKAQRTNKHPKLFATVSSQSTSAAEKLTLNMQHLGLQSQQEVELTNTESLEVTESEQIMQPSCSTVKVNHNIAPNIKDIEQPTSNNDHSKQSDEGCVVVNNECNATQKECIVCDEVLSLIKFEPCMHQISCEECGKRMKKCLKCGTCIYRRIDSNGFPISNTEMTKPPSSDRLRYLEKKILEYEESHYCSICMERIRDVAFLCGHGSCSKCAETLRTCHMCRKTILKKINLY